MPTITPGSDQHARNTTTAIPVRPMTGIALAASASPLTDATTPPNTNSTTRAPSKPSAPPTTFKIASTFTCVSMTGDYLWRRHGVKRRVTATSSLSAQRLVEEPKALFLTPPTDKRRGTRAQEKQRRWFSYRRRG